MTDLTAQFASGHAFWVWKENSQGSWGYFDAPTEGGEWTLRQAVIDNLTLPFVAAAPGLLNSQSWDPESGTLSFSFTSSGGEPGLLIYLPGNLFPSHTLRVGDGTPNGIHDAVDGEQTTVFYGYWHLVRGVWPAGTWEGIAMP